MAFDIPRTARQLARLLSAAGFTVTGATEGDADAATGAEVQIGVLAVQICKDAQRDGAVEYVIQRREFDTAGIVVAATAVCTTGVVPTLIKSLRAAG